MQTDTFSHPDLCKTLQILITSASKSFSDLKGTQDQGLSPEFGQGWEPLFQFPKAVSNEIFEMEEMVGFYAIFYEGEQLPEEIKSAYDLLAAQVHLCLENSWEYEPEDMDQGVGVFSGNSWISQEGDMEVSLTIYFLEGVYSVELAVVKYQD